MLRNSEGLSASDCREHRPLRADVEHALCCQTWGDRRLTAEVAKIATLARDVISICYVQSRPDLNAAHLETEDVLSSNLWRMMSANFFRSGGKSGHKQNPKPPSAA